MRIALALPVAALVSAGSVGRAEWRAAAPPLLVRVTVSGPAADSALRIVDLAASRDTLWIQSPGALVARLREPVQVVTFIASPGHRLHVEARDSTAAGPLTADGEMVVVVRTPRGPEVQAMAVPTEFQRPR
jgi:hypothetical protein